MGVAVQDQGGRGGMGEEQREARVGAGGGTKRPQQGCKGGGSACEARFVGRSDRKRIDFARVPEDPRAPTEVHDRR